MDTDHKIEKKALSLSPSDLVDAIRNTAHGSMDFLKGYLALSAAAGLIGGGALGLGASTLKKRDPELKSLERRRRFYENQIEEMKNTNWLNDLIAARRRLETGRLSPEERADLEKKYRELISR